MPSLRQSSILVVVRLSLIIGLSQTAFGQIDGKKSQPAGESKDLLIDLDHQIVKQQSLVNKFALKGQLLSEQLKLNFDQVEAQRAAIRDSLRSRFYRESTEISDGLISARNTRSLTDVPNRVSIYFAMVEHAELKNKQSRTRALFGSYKNLVKTYLNEAQELDRLILLKEMTEKGFKIEADHIERPSMSGPSDVNVREFSKEGKELRNQSEQAEPSFGVKALTGAPKVGDMVAAKSRPIYVLKDRLTADKLMRASTSFTIQKLEEMLSSGNAAKLTPTTQARILYEEGPLVRIQFIEKGTENNNFVGWIDKTRLVRIQGVE